MLKRDPLAYAALIASSALFATGYIAARWIHPDAGMDMFVTQVMFAGAVALSFFKRKGSLKEYIHHHLWPIMANAAGTPVVVYFVLKGSRVITPSLSSIIVISNALLIAVIAWGIGRKRFTGIQTAALTAGFCGVVWISLERGALGGEWGGVAALLVSSVIIAVITVMLEDTVTGIGGLAPTLLIFWISFALCSIAMVFTQGVWFHSAGQTALAFFLGVFGMAAPVLLFNIGMGRIGAADAAAFKLLIPFFALVYGYLLLGEMPTASSALAGFLVIASVWAYHHYGERR